MALPKFNLADRLARVTTSGRRIRELDGLRFVAIASVVLQHTYEVVEEHYRGAAPPLSLATHLFVRDIRFGVELFFVISGFILALPFATQRLLGGRPVPLGAYYWRRVTRLEPPYLLTLGLWYAVNVFYWHQPAGDMGNHLLASAFYVHNLVYAHDPRGYMSLINSVAWSLEIEVQFYLLAPLLAWVFAIRGRWVRRAVIMIAGVVIEQSHKHAGHLPHTVYDYLPLFLIGFLLADVYLLDWGQQPPPSRWVDPVGIVALVLCACYFQTPTFHGHPLLPMTTYPWMVGLFAWAGFRGVWVRRFLASGFVMTVGGMCYSVYLLHFPMLRILGVYAPIPLPATGTIGLNTLIYVVVWGAVVLAASATFFLLVEKPCMRKDWPQRLAARLRSDPVPPDRLPAGVPAGSPEASLDVSPAAVAPLAQDAPVP